MRSSLPICIAIISRRSRPPNNCVGCAAGAAALSCPAEARSGVKTTINKTNTRRASMGITAGNDEPEGTVTPERKVMFTPLRPHALTASACGEYALHPIAAAVTDTQRFQLRRPLLMSLASRVFFVVALCLAAVPALAQQQASISG